MMPEHFVSHTTDNSMDSSRQAYMLPHSRREIERMKNQHEWIKGAFGGLIKAPIDYEKKGQSILDSATADGTWLCDVSTLFPPETELVGCDIAPELYPPSDLLPPNVELVIGDLLTGLPDQWTQHFDLVHQRFILPGFSNEVAGSILDKLMACVKPGGWIQLVEPIAHENVSGPDPLAFITLHRLANICMKSPNPKDAILSKLKEGGFVNVNVQMLDVVIGKFQDNKELDARGRKNMRATIKNMLSATNAKELGMSDADWNSFIDRFDEDMRKYRTAVRHVTIWGQKPE